jgi:predicted GNAT family N-acyltransferase
MTLTTDIEVKLVNNEKLLELVYKLRNDVFVKEMKVVTETDIDE